LEQRLEQIVEQTVVAHCQPERDADQYREPIAEHLAPQRRDQVPGYRAVRDILEPRFEDTCDCGPGRRREPISGRKLPDQKQQGEQNHARRARIAECGPGLHGTSARPAMTCATMLRKRYSRSLRYSGSLRVSICRLG